MYAESHIGNTSSKPRAEASKALGSIEQEWQVRQVKQRPHLLTICYRNSWHMAWHGHRIDPAVTEDNRETTFLFQRLSIAFQRENAVSFHNTIHA